MSELSFLPSRLEPCEELAPALQRAVRRAAATLVALFTLHVARGDAAQRATEDALDTLATLDSIGGTVAVDAALVDAERVLCREGTHTGIAIVTWMTVLSSTVHAWR